MTAGAPDTCPFCAVLPALEAGSHPDLLAALPRTFALLSENQGCLGWCVLVLRTHAEHLADLRPADQLAVFADVARAGAALRAAFPGGGPRAGPVRINYECLGNVVPHVHWHVIPRHADDPDPRRPVWGWPPEQLRGRLTPAERGALRDRLRAAFDAVV